MKQMDNRKRQFMMGTGMLGMVTILLLARLIGDLGMAYFAAAIEVFVLLQLLLTACVPDCVEKLIRSRMAKEQYKNADKMCRVTFWYCAVAGILGALFLFFSADLWMDRLLYMPEAALTLKLLAPVFFLQAASAVLQGYFQGMGTEMPTVVSGAVKQVLGLVFTVIFASRLYRYGEKAAALLHSSRFANMYGATGAAIGLLCATLLTLCFLLLLYLGAGRRARKQKTEGMRLTEDGIELLRLLMATLAPAAGLHFLLRAVTLLGLFFYQHNQTGGENGLLLYGAYYGKYLVLTGVVILLALLLCAKVENTVVHAVRKEEYKNAKDALTGVIQTTFLCTAFWAAAFSALAPYLMKALFGEGEGTSCAVACMQQGFLLMVFLPMGICFGRILSGIGRRKQVLLHLLGSLLCYVIVAAVGLRLTEGSVLVLVYAQIIFAAVYCALNGFFLMRAIRFTMEWLHMLLLPLLAAGVTGLGLLLLGKALFSLVDSALVVLISLLAGGFCYLILLLVFRCVRERELYMLPGGNLLRRLGSFLHLI